MAQQAVTGAAAAPMPARLSAWAIYDVFETRDQPVFVGVVSDALWQKFCALFALDELWADQSLRRNNDRVRARDRILPSIRALLLHHTRDEIVALLEGSGIPFAPIGRPEDMFDDPHLLASGGLERVTLADGSVTFLPALPLELDGMRAGRVAELPEPGADGAPILRRLGLTPDEIDALAGPPDR